MVICPLSAVVCAVNRVIFNAGRLTIAQKSGCLVSSASDFFKSNICNSRSNWAQIRIGISCSVEMQCDYVMIDCRDDKSFSEILCPKT